MDESATHADTGRDEGESRDAATPYAGHGHRARARRRRLAVVTAAAVMATLAAGAGSAAAQNAPAVGLGLPLESEVEGLAAPDEQFGAAIATGDLNGDTYDDAAIGVPADDVDGVRDAGAVNVIYGSKFGLSATEVPDQLWHQNVEGAEGEAEVADNFGSAVAVGDFNHDGYDDLAVGVPGEDVDGVADAGAVNIIYGSKDGLSATEVPDQLWHQDTFGVEDAAEALDRFGDALTVGRLNGDDYDDLAIGVQAEDVDGVLDAGAVNVIYGSAAGLSTAPQAEPGSVRVRGFWHQNVANVQGGLYPRGGFGTSLATGNFDGDRYDDLAIGRPLSVIVIHGSSGGLSPRGTVTEFWHQNAPGVEDVVELGDDFGEQVATGDFNHDGYDDLAIGVPGETIGDELFTPHNGAVNLIYGSNVGLSTFATPDQLWHQDVAGVEGDNGTIERFGHGLAVGRFDGDAYDDLAIGVAADFLLTAPFAGSVNVIHGSSQGLSVGHRADQLWNQDVAEVEDRSERGDRFGWAVATGRFNGDRYDDLAIGVPGENVGSLADAGAVNVIHGTGASLSAIRIEDQLLHQDS